MNLNRCLVLAAVVSLGFSSIAPTTKAQDPDQTDVMKELQRREDNAQRLPVEDQLKIRAAQQKALEDAGVKAAMAKRDQAIAEFRTSLRAAMIAADPSVKPILDKVAGGSDVPFPVKP